MIRTKINRGSRDAGVRQVKEFPITSAANAGVVTIATVTTKPCLIRSIVLHSNGSTTTDLIDAAIQGGASQVVTFIEAADAIQALLDSADKQGWWEGSVRFAVGKTIIINLNGSGSTAVDFTITIEYEACINGGHLT